MTIKELLHKENYNSGAIKQMLSNKQLKINDEVVTDINIELGDELLDAGEWLASHDLGFINLFGNLSKICDNVDVLFGGGFNWTNEVLKETDKLSFLRVSKKAFYIVK